MMKKISAILLICLLLIPWFIPPETIEAKTLNDIYNELNKLKSKKNDNLYKKNKTQSQINKIRDRIVNNSRQIEQAETDIIKAEEEITRLTEEIKERDAEIKELMVFLQISQGESAYLEYAFGAQDFTDFVYRLAIAEQLSDYNDKLLEEMNNKILENKNKKEELRKKQEELSVQRNSLSKEMSSLGKELNALTDASLDINAEIKAINDLIKAYEAMGCKRYDDISVCAKTPIDTMFSKPLKSGKVTSNFGYREFYLDGKLVKGFHYGMDMTGGSGEGTPIYAAANGRVAAITFSNCGGNMLFLHHTVNNKHYTTSYYHLLTINVKVGQFITRGSQIATMGGGKKTASYDSCSTGAHLHFQIATGHYLGAPPIGYSGWETYQSRSINPRNLISFPAKGVYW